MLQPAYDFSKSPLLRLLLGMVENRIWSAILLLYAQEHLEVLTYLVYPRYNQCGDDVLSTIRCL